MRRDKEIRELESLRATLGLIQIATVERQEREKEKEEEDGIEEGRIE